jgi:predicted metal-dependent hydrolase
MARASDTPPLEREEIHRIRKGVEEFNSGKFFECHDTLEEVWRGTRGPARAFLQGLIQISVGFYHLNNRNLRGGQSQLDKGLRKLESYGEEYLGMELVQLRREVGGWLDRVRAGEKLEADLKDLPKLHFRPSIAQ